jgi:hypothetical protein
MAVRFFSRVVHVQKFYLTPRAKVTAYPFAAANGNLFLTASATETDAVAGAMVSNIMAFFYKLTKKFLRRTPPPTVWQGRAKRHFFDLPVRADA